MSRTKLQTLSIQNTSLKTKTYQQHLSHRRIERIGGKDSGSPNESGGWRLECSKRIEKVGGRHGCFEIIGERLESRKNRAKYPVLRKKSGKDSGAPTKSGEDSGAPK